MKYLFLIFFATNLISCSQTSITSARNPSSEQVICKYISADNGSEVLSLTIGEVQKSSDGWASVEFSQNRLYTELSILFHKRASASINEQFKNKSSISLNALKAMKDDETFTVFSIDEKGSSYRIVECSIRR